MSNLATLAAAITRPRTGRPCSVAVALTKLRRDDPESAADLDAWLHGENLDLLGSDGDVHHALQTLGHRVGKQSIGRHRRAIRGYGSGCSCSGTT